MFDITKFKIRLIEMKLTNEEVAQKMGINSATLYRKIKGNSDFTRQEIQALRKILLLNSETADGIFFTSKLT